MDYSDAFPPKDPAATPFDDSGPEAGPGAATTKHEPSTGPFSGDMPPVGKKFISLYTAATLAAATALNTPLFVTLALRVSDIDPNGKTTSFALLSGLGMLVSTLSAPAFGALSDRTRSRFGMRRPWIVLGLAGTAAGGGLLGAADDLATLTIGWLIMSAFGTAVASLLLAAITDWVPEQQQGLLGGLVGASNLIAVVVGSTIIAFVPHNSLLQVNLPVAWAVVAVLLFTLSFPDRRFADMVRAEPGEDRPAPAGRLRGLLLSVYFDPRESPDFARFLASLFLVSLGGALGTTYSVYFIEDHLRVGDDALPSVIAYANALTCLPALVFSPLAGWTADKIGRRRPVLLTGVALTAVGFVIIAFGDGLSWFYLGSLVTGLGTAAYTGIYLAYAVATMDGRQNSARDLGLTNVAISLPLTLAPFITPLFLHLGSGDHNYVSLYIGGALVSIAGVPLMYMIRKAR